MEIGSFYINPTKAIGFVFREVEDGLNGKWIALLTINDKFTVRPVWSLDTFVEIEPSEEIINRFLHSAGLYRAEWANVFVGTGASRVRDADLVIDLLESLL